MPQGSDESQDKWSAMFKKGVAPKAALPFEDEPVPEDETEIVIKVLNCSRCFHKHTDMVFHRFTKPSTSGTHWALCPRTDEPMLLTLEEASGVPVPDA